jgi:hypothetical protein
MKTMFTRKGRTLRDLESGTENTFDSINQAKRESRRLQRRNGGLGRGSLRVI